MWQKDQIVTAHGSEFSLESVFVMVSIVLFLVGHQLLGRFVAAADVVVDEVDEADSVRPMSELKVNSMPARLTLDINTLLRRIMLQDQLLQEQECSLVIDPLSYLHLRLPEMWCVYTLTVVTLQVLDRKFYDKSLLNLGTGHNILLDC
jgi:hypothetical protein